jgi:diguanylate cyclase (GGDEF)-like protein
MSDSSDILMEYLRSILYDPEISAPDIDSLEEPYRKLGKGLRVLQQDVEEMREYSAELSKGNLSVERPANDNMLCANLKSIHSTLNHLTWQAQQVAAGDYSQRVSFLGEFSDAFNTMTKQLRDRETSLRAETAELKERTEAISVYNELLIKMTANRSEWILVVDEKTKNVVYCNKSDNLADELVESPCLNCKQNRLGMDEILSWNSTDHEIWEMCPAKNKYFQVHSYPVEWRGKNSYVHVVRDVSKHKLENSYLSDKAYIDPVSSVHNRLYFNEYMDKVIEEKKLVTLCYVDLDGLKYVNDHFGHAEGDAYILAFAELIKKNFRKDDVFARIGGDEFCIVLEGSRSELAVRKLEAIRDMLVENNVKNYPMSFSYGVHEVDGGADGLTIEFIMQEADAKMYEYKRTNKKARE